MLPAGRTCVVHVLFRFLMSARVGLLCVWTMAPARSVFGKQDFISTLSETVMPFLILRNLSNICYLKKKLANFFFLSIFLQRQAELFFIIWSKDDLCSWHMIISLRNSDISAETNICFQMPQRLRFLATSTKAR